MGNDSKELKALIEKYGADTLRRRANSINESRSREKSGDDRIGQAMRLAGRTDFSAYDEILANLDDEGYDEDRRRRAKKGLEHQRFDFENPHNLSQKARRGRLWSVISDVDDRETPEYRPSKVHLRNDLRNTKAFIHDIDDALGHMRNKTGRFADCPFCGASADDEAVVKVNNRYHGTDVRVRDGETAYYCQECGKTWAENNATGKKRDLHFNFIEKQPE